LGNLFARTFAESGSNSIVILDLNKEQAETAAADLMTWFEEHGQCDKGEIKAVGMGCDVSNEAQVQDCFAKVKALFGRVDVLVTAAGIVGSFNLLLPSLFLPVPQFLSTSVLPTIAIAH